MASNNSKIEITVQNAFVTGIDTTKRARTFRDLFVKKTNYENYRIPILNGVTFRAKAGDRIGIIGRNGSGKSSLLKVITGNYPLESGYLKVSGSIFPLIEMGAGFEPELTGRENIKMSFAIRGRLSEFNADVEAKIIEFSELGEKIDLPLKSYSSGMHARLAFSSAAHSKADILLFDEVLATGDGAFQQKSTNLIQTKIDSSAITIIVSHSLDEIKSMCNRFVLMSKGRIVSDSASGEVLNQYRQDILGN